MVLLEDILRKGFSKGIRNLILLENESARPSPLVQ